MKKNLKEILNDKNMIAALIIGIVLAITTFWTVDFIILNHDKISDVVVRVLVQLLFALPCVVGIVLCLRKRKKSGDTADVNSSSNIQIESATKKPAGPSVNRTTFVCDICHRELQIKYCAKRNMCVECAEKESEERRERLSNRVKNDANVSFGSFSFSDVDRSKIKRIADGYMPEKLDNVDAQRILLSFLDSFVDTSAVRFKTDYLWRRVTYETTGDMNQQLFLEALAETIYAINQSIGLIGKSLLLENVTSANREELLKAWVTLDYYCHCYVAKPEYKKNILNFRDYIHSKILAPDDDSAQKVELIKKFTKVVREIMNKKQNDAINDFEACGAKKTDAVAPARLEGTSVYLDSAALMKWKTENPYESVYRLMAAVPCKEKEPVITLIDDGVKTREYRLQTENGEDFTGKYFMLSVCLAVSGNPPLAVAQLDGFLSDTSDERVMTMDDIGYRMEGYFLRCGGETAKMQYEATRGQDLTMKALKYLGYTTPANVRLIGVCPDCKKSFAFHGYAFYMGQSDVAYSDDGLDVCEIVAYDINKDTWSCETEGKTFRYYNSFCCPHCGAAYIDYKNNPQIKTFGVSGCVHIGRKYYQYS